MKSRLNFSRPSQDTRQDSRHKARQGKARQGKARQGKARQGKARQGKARQGKARQDKARQDKTRQDFNIVFKTRPKRNTSFLRQGSRRDNDDNFLKIDSLLMTAFNC